MNIYCVANHFDFDSAYITSCKIVFKQIMFSLCPKLIEKARKMTLCT